ncbi:MAG: RluA family pseudouridine synthase [Treponema sp.]|jgi:23S rRNA pseudouridine1911/1915/1917 synthase|nr:RluA family pseudouridine synthase [Treponema sp.]
MPLLSGVIKEKFPSLRLDRYVSEHLKILSRSQIKTRNLKAKINGKDVKFSRLVKQGDNFEFYWDDSLPADIIPQDIPLNIIYEDRNCVVVDKTQGMVVHPGAGNRQGTLANALYYRRLNQKNVITSGSANKTIYEKTNNLRTGIVHRLDKDTSGIIIAAYNDETHAFLARQFKAREARKIYIAVVQGALKEKKGRINTFISRDFKDRRRFVVSANGKNAVTFFKVIKSWQNHSLVLLSPRTGRTHQLRVHMHHIGYPVLGDPVYGNIDSVFPEASLMLHSKSLAITLTGETEKRVFSSLTLPDRFSSVMQKLNRMNADG